MIKYKITAHIANGIVSFDGIFSLDAILDYALWDLSGKPDIKKSKNNPFALPIERFYFDKETWCWYCSFGKCEINGRGTYYVNRKFPNERLEFLNQKTKSICISCGKFKGYRIPLPIIYTPKIEWIIAGNPDKIMMLLQQIDFIGKKHFRGCGEILRWEIGETLEHPIYDGKILKRSVPFDWAQEKGLPGYRRQGKLRPPYNNKSNQTIFDCIFPIPLS